MVGAKPSSANQNVKYDCFHCAFQIFHIFCHTITANHSWGQHWFHINGKVLMSIQKMIIINLNGKYNSMWFSHSSRIQWKYPPTFFCESSVWGRVTVYWCRAATSRVSSDDDLSELCCHCRDQRDVTSCLWSRASKILKSSPGLFTTTPTKRIKTQHTTGFIFRRET